MLHSFKKISESGFSPAIRGLSLNFNTSFEVAREVSKNICSKEHGENKFLQMMVVWLEVTVPRYIWQDFDTYRLTVKQSESTNHTIMKGELSAENFERGMISADTLEELNSCIKERDFLGLKARLPEGFLQKRVWMLNYANIRNIIAGRKKHRLPIIREFCTWLYENVDYPEYLADLYEGTKCNTYKVKK